MQAFANVLKLSSTISCSNCVSAILLELKRVLPIHLYHMNTWLLRCVEKFSLSYRTMLIFSISSLTTKLNFNCRKHILKIVLKPIRVVLNQLYRVSRLLTRYMQTANRNYCTRIVSYSGITDFVCAFTDLPHLNYVCHISYVPQRMEVLEYSWYNSICNVPSFCIK